MKFKQYKEDRSNLAVWCRKYPNWLLKMIVFLSFPLFLIAPMFTDDNIFYIIKQWWKYLNTTYEYPKDTPKCYQTGQSVIPVCYSENGCNDCKVYRSCNQYDKQK